MSDLFVSGPLGAESELNGNREFIRKSQGRKNQVLTLIKYCTRLKRNIFSSHYRKDILSGSATELINNLFESRMMPDRIKGRILFQPTEIETTCIS
jgi:hypothetical protein